MLDSNKLSLKEKLGYALGDGAANIAWRGVATFLFIFYTDVFGLSPVTVGVLMLVARFSDGISDVLMGVIGDRTKSKYGKFRPWILWTAIPLGAILSLLFTSPDLGDFGKIVYAYVTYIFFTLIYTANNVPYGALMAVMTGDDKERTSLGSFRMVGAFGGGMLVQGALLFLVAYFGNVNPEIAIEQLEEEKFRVIVSADSDVESVNIKTENGIADFVWDERSVEVSENVPTHSKSFAMEAHKAYTFIVTGEPDLEADSINLIDQKRGYGNSMYIMSIFLSLFMFVTFYTTKERIQPPKTQKNNLKRDLKDLIRNKPWLVLLAIGLLFNVYNSIKQGIVIIYFTHYLNNQLLAASFLVALMLASVAGAMATAPLGKRFGKRNLFIAALLFSGGVNSLFFFLGPTDVTAVFTIGVVSEFASAIFPTLFFVMLGDAADYSEFKNGRRATGLIYSAGSFATKFGGGIAGAIIGFVLGAFAYDGQNAASIEGSIPGIIMLMSWIPAVITVLAAIFMLIYPLNQKKMDELPQNCPGGDYKKKKFKSYLQKYKEMKYGHFDDANREYVITDPKTPYPWINYLGNEDFFSLTSNTGGGYTFYKDAKFRRLTRYRYNNVPVDDGGKYFYIKDEDTVWSPGWKPVKTALDSYECRHGMSYTKIKGTKNGVSAEVLQFIPLGFWGEIQKVTISNDSAQRKKLKLFSFVEWCLWNAEDDMTNFQRNFNTGEVEVEDSVIYHKTEFKERRNHYAFYGVNGDIQGYDTDRESFLGLYNGFDNPDVVRTGVPGNTLAHGWSPIASHYIEIELEPGATKDLVFMLGYVEVEEDKKWESKGVINKQPAKEMMAQFDTTDKVDQAFNALRSYWDDLLCTISVASGDEKLDRMVNIWNQYQCMVTFNMSRSASFFESGIGRGMGFRDSNQDLIGFVHQIPERARERIVDIASTQFEDGSCYHQYQPLTKKGNAAIGGDFNDDPLWLILSTTAYIKETGDFSLLDEMVPFDNDSSRAKPHFEHLKASFYHVVNNLGPHKLPLIGRADWNDCLNLNCFSSDPNESFQTTGNKKGDTAESLMIAGLFVVYGKEYVDLCRYVGKDAEAEEAQIHVDQMIDAVKAHGWDGDWYLRAYDYYGKKIGSDENEEGKIFVESQGWCAMAEIGKEEGMVEKALDAVKEHLDCDYGIVLNYPAFTKYHIEYGEISTYPAGYKENGGIFCHNNPWIMIGETMIGRGDKAYEYYTKIAPSFLEDISELHKVEPYVYCQMIAGKEAFKPGEAKNSWLSGTASWNFYAITQYILGIRPEYDGLRVDPCIPEKWTGFKMQRKFRGATYQLDIKNPNNVSKGVKEIIVNGAVQNSNLIPLLEKGKDHEVVIIMG